MPDEAREVIFPQGVPVRAFDAAAATSTPEAENGHGQVQQPSRPQPEPFSTESEGELSSEDEQLREQAREAPSPEGEENLLRD